MPIYGMAHRSFEYGLCLQLEPIVKKLKEKSIIVPMISEIYEPTAEQAIKTLSKTKTKICDYWDS